MLTTEDLEALRIGVALVFDRKIRALPYRGDADCHWKYAQMFWYHMDGHSLDQTAIHYNLTSAYTKQVINACIDSIRHEFRRTYAAECLGIEPPVPWHARGFRQAPTTTLYKYQDQYLRRAVAACEAWRPGAFSGIGGDKCIELMGLSYNEQEER